MGKKFFVGLVVALGVTLVVPGLAKKTGDPGDVEAQNDVLWTVQSFLELSVSASSYDFGVIDPGVDTVSASEAVILYVESNISWSLGYTVEGTAAKHLQVALSQDSGSGDAKIPVDYTLVKLRSLAPGDYQVTVIYTATAA